MDHIGSQLQEARIARNMSLEDVSRITRITKTTLGVIEAGSAEETLAPIYYRGFVRSYAKAIGMDERELLRSMPVQEAAAPSITKGSQSFAPTRHEEDTFDGLLGHASLKGPRFHGGHGLMALIAIGMFLTAWFTVGVRSDQSNQGPNSPPALGTQVNTVSSQMQTDASTP